jgi:hypothetical protein
MLAAGIAAAGMLVFGASGVNAATPARLGAAVVDRVGASPAAIKAYWTAARMRAARPAALLARSAGAVAAVPARRAAAEPSRTARRRSEIATPVLKPRQHPTRTHGKVFFSAGVDQYECSGTAAQASSRSLVLTAAHCAYLRALLGSTNVVHNWIFVPAYANGRAPFGKWAATSLAAPNGWVSSNPVIGPGGEITGGDSRFDLGAATVAPRASGRALQGAVGGATVGFDRPRRHRYTAFGYPAEGPYTGRREFSCLSPYLGADSAFGKPPPIQIRCDMTAGASGGGWIDPRGRLVSVTSYGYSNDSQSLYGPYFGTALHDFYGSVSGG